MNSGQNPQSIQQLQLIVGALIFGVASFFAFTLFVDPGASGENDSTLLIALAGLSVPAIVGSFVIRMVHANSIREELREAHRAGDRTLVPNSYLRATLISAAIVEGFGLFGVVVYFLTRSPYALIAVGLALVIMMWNFPTQSKLDDMAEA